MTAHEDDWMDRDLSAQRRARSYRYRAASYGRWLDRRPAESWAFFAAGFLLAWILT